VLKVEVVSAASLASVHGEVDELTRRVSFLEGELIDVHQERNMAEANLQGLSNKMADVNRWQEDAGRQC
jgi:hypothetical protein